MSLSKFLWGSKKNNPTNAAMPYINQGIQTQQPYVDRGNQASTQLNDQYSQMSQDPNAYFNKIAGGYQQSAGFQDKQNELLRQANNTAAAGGYVGGEQHQKGALGLTNALMNEDFQNWYNNVMGIQGKGQAGQQHIGDQGFDASSNMANLYGQQGQLAFQGKDWENRRQQEQANQLMKLLATGGGAVAGGFVGGPAGAMQGAQMGSKFF